MGKKYKHETIFGHRVSLEPTQLSAPGLSIDHEHDGHPLGGFFMRAILGGKRFNSKEYFLSNHLVERSLLLCESHSDHVNIRSPDLLTMLKSISGNYIGTSISPIIDEFIIKLEDSGYDFSRNR